MTPRERAVKHLSSGKLGLQDREVIGKTGLTVGLGKGVREALEPFPRHPLDLGFIEGVQDLLQLLGRLTAEDPVVQGLIGDPFLVQLPLRVLMAVETDTRRVREIPRELDEERPEILVNEVEIILIAHDRRSAQPRKGLAGLGTDSLLHPKGRVSLLRNTEVEQPFGFVEALQTVLGNGVLPLPFGEPDHLHLFTPGKALNLTDKSPAHRRHQGRGRDTRASVALEEGRDPGTGLQPRLIGVEIETVDPFDIQGYVLR